MLDTAVSRTLETEQTARNKNKKSHHTTCRKRNEKSINGTLGHWMGVNSLTSDGRGQLASGSDDTNME